MTINSLGVPDLSGNNAAIISKKASPKLTGTFSATGVSNPVLLYGLCNAELNFGTGSVTVQRSLDGGVTFVNVVLPDGITPATYTQDASFVLDAGKGMLICFSCTSWSQNISYRIE